MTEEDDRKGGEDLPSFHVSLVVWDKLESGTRIIDSEHFDITDTRDLKFLPVMGFDLGEKLLDGMILEHVGGRRGGAEHQRADVKDKKK